jgi:hypothetical protein
LKADRLAIETDTLRSMPRRRFPRGIARQNRYERRERIITMS